jgi:hypothetical protein
LTWCHPQRYVSVTLQLVGSSPALAEERVRDFEVLVPSVPQAHQAMWAFSGLAHGADALRRGHTNIATEAVVRAPADGYTLLLANAANAINATLYEIWTSISSATSRQLRASQASPLSSKRISRPFEDVGVAVA